MVAGAATPRFCTASALALTARAGVAARLAGAVRVGLGQEFGRGMMEFAGGLVAVAARLAVLAGVDLRHAGLRIGGRRRLLAAGVGGLVAGLRAGARPCAAFGATRGPWPAACNAGERVGLRRAGFGGGGGEGERRR